MATLLGTACEAEDPEAAPATPLASETAQPATIQYVALGDSYTAAPLVPTTDTSDACLRSDGNYPHLLAAALPGSRLTDVSCSSADSRAMTGPQSTRGGGSQPPQLDAVSEDTDLVTLGIGGNDFGLFGRMAVGCLRLADSDPQGAPCRAANGGPDGDRLLEIVPRIQARVARVIDAIRERAPDATVVVVDYPQILPSSGSCRGIMPVARGDYDYVTEVNKALSDAVLAAAEESDATTIDLYAASRGHDVCSDEPWVNGIATIPGAALALHPFAAGQRAVAELILAGLEP